MYKLKKELKYSFGLQYKQIVRYLKKYKINLKKCYKLGYSIIFPNIKTKIGEIVIGQGIIFVDIKTGWFYLFLVPNHKYNEFILYPLPENQIQRFIHSYYLEQKHDND